MESDEQKRLIKRVAAVAALFALALVLYRLRLRSLLLAYVLVVGVMMVMAILLQAGRGGGLASIGGLGGDSLFGTRSSTPIAKATYVMGALLLFTCVLLARLGPVKARAVTGVIGTPAETVVEPPVNIDLPPVPEGPPEPPAGEAGEEGEAPPSP